MAARDTITIEFIGDTAKLVRASSTGMRKVTSDVKDAEGDVGKSADRMADKFEDAFEGLHGRIGTKIGPGFASLGGDLGGKLIGGFAALGVGAVVSDQLSEALSIDAGVDKLEARLGLTAKEAERIGKRAGQTYAGAWGDSMEDVQNSYAETMRAFPKLTDDALQQVTESALTTADVWDQDFNEVVRAAQNLLVNGLAPDAQTAMDMVATALQKTKGPQDEVLSALREYSDHFAVLGLDGTQVLGGLTSEWANNEFAIDKVGDSIKELGIRVLDGSDTTKQGLKDIGLSIGEVEDAFAKGGDTAKEMTERIIEGIIGIEDPAERARAGVALMGTPFEDLGNNAVPILEDVLEGQKNLTDTVEVGNTAYDNAQTAIESWRRQGLQKLTEFIGGKVIPAIEDELVPAVDDASDVISGDARRISRAVERHLGVNVPDTLNRSGESFDSYAQRVDEARRDSIQSFSDLGDTINSQTLTWGEKFGLIWSDIWDESAREARRRRNGILDGNDEWYARMLRGLIEWDRRFAQGWNDLWAGKRDTQREWVTKILAGVVGWWGRMIDRQDAFAAGMSRGWSRLWANVWRIANTAGRVVLGSVRGWGNDLVAWFRGLPGRIIRSIGNIGARIRDAFMKVLGAGLRIPINLIFGGDGLGLLGTGRGGGALLGISESAAVAKLYRSIGSPGDVISGYRPGARTLSGNLSYHARGRALDFTPIKSVAQLLYTAFRGRIKELISPWPELGVLNGRPWRFSDAVQAQHDGRTNVRHIHLAAERGALLREPTVLLAAESAAARAGGGEVVSPVAMMADTFRAVLAEFVGGGQPLYATINVVVDGRIVDSRVERVTAAQAARASTRAWKG